MDYDYNYPGGKRRSLIELHVKQFQVYCYKLDAYYHHCYWYINIYVAGALRKTGGIQRDRHSEFTLPLP